MKTVKDRAEARWLPSRFRYAIFRLFAYGMIRRSRPREVNGLVLVIDRDQSASEYYVISAWLLVTVTCYVGAVLSRVTSGTIAAIAALPVALLIIDLPIFLPGLVMPALRAAGVQQKHSLRVASILLYGLLTIAASYLVLEQSWVRYVAFSFFAILLVNAIAAVVVWSLRGRIADVERAYGVAA